MASTKKKDINFIKNHIKELTNNEYECISNKYENQYTKLTIRHYISQTEYHDFITTWKSFNRGHRCTICENNRKIKFCNSKKLTLEQVKENIKNADSEYICIATKYIKNNIPIELKHLKCGNEIKIRYGDFMNGHRCPICSNKKKGQYQITPYEDVKKYIEQNNEYILLTKKEEYKNHSTKLKIKHISCGTIFEKSFDLFKNYNQGCLKCCYIKSKKEKEIANYLIENNIEFVFQKKFEDCKDVNELLFDFYIPSKNLIIEYDGRQHYIPIPRFGGEEYLNKVKKHDLIKNNYCKEKNINILRISYLQDNDIINILNNEFKNNN